MLTNQVFERIITTWLASANCSSLNVDTEVFSMKTMREAKVGDTVKVVRVHGEGALRRRIMDMGITRGIEIYIRKVAPLGDPFEITVRGYELSLRKSDCEMIEIE